MKQFRELRPTLEQLAKDAYDLLSTKLREQGIYVTAIEYRVKTEKSLAGKLELKEATLYTAFRRLEAAGCIRSYWGDENIGARRRYYSLTESGRKKLSEDIEFWIETREVLNRLLEGD